MYFRDSSVVLSILLHLGYLAYSLVYQILDLLHLPACLEMPQVLLPRFIQQLGFVLRYYPRMRSHFLGPVALLGVFIEQSEDEILS